MIERLLMKLRARDEVSAAEEQALRAAVSHVREHPADTVIVREGELLNESILLLDGLLGRFKDLLSGERQFTELHVAGDFADLHGFTLKRLDHEVMALTRCTVALVPHDNLRAITEQHPHLTRLLWFSTNLDAAIHREWELSLGRRTALSRMAHLFCELHVRLGLVGLVEGDTYELALTQVELSQCLGLTPVHVNRTLMELRERQVVEFRDRRVTIRQPEALRQIAEFNESYLYLERLPR